MCRLARGEPRDKYIIMYGNNFNVKINYLELYNMAIDSNSYIHNTIVPYLFSVACMQYI